MTARRRRPGTAGFTLLETLVALAILGVVLTTVFDIFGKGLRAAHRDEDRLLLALVAQNLMARTRLDYNPTEGDLHGDIEGGLRWAITSEPYEPPQDLLPERQAPQSTSQLARRDDNGGSFGSSGTGGFGDRSGSYDSGSGFGSAGGSAFGDRSGGSGLGDRSGGSSFGDQSGSGGFGNRAEGGGPDAGPGGDETRSGPQGTQPREKIRLRLVRVSVQKGEEHFELTSLVMEPRRGRAASR